MNKDELYMRRALDLAVRGRGQVSPNPMVGAVLVADDQLIGEGWHEQYGGPHAEVQAIRSVKDTSLIPEATAYVTLEPCSHFGKTPPCADLLAEHRVRRVVIGTTDPNPLVAGKGIRRLKEAGIEVVTGVLEPECLDINSRYFTAGREQRPYIILKWAQTLDGFIARSDYSSKWISGSSSRALVHKWRAEEDAVMIGPNTARYDNPTLTTRDWPGRNALRVVLDRSGRLPGDLHVFTDGLPTLYYSSLQDPGNRECTHIQVPEDQFIHHVFVNLHERGIHSVLSEGGAGIHKMLLEENLWDEVRVFQSNGTFGDGIKAPGLPAGKLRKMRYDRDDLLIIKRNQ